MPASNITDLLAAAIKSGQLVTNKESVVIAPELSKRFGKAILDELKDVPVEKSKDGSFTIVTDKVHGHEKEYSLLETIRRVRAKEAIKAAWERAGGPMSKVGLPLDASMPVREIEPGKWATDCRSGQMQFMDHEGHTFESVTHEVNVRLVAIECQVRQEKADEVYGVVSIHGPANNLFSSVTVPGSGTITMGPTGARLTFPELPLVTDIPVEDVYIRVAWIENDSGNEKDIAKKVSEKMQQAAAAAAGALIGAGAEAVTASQDETFYEASLWVVGTVLGMGDDAYPVEGKFISAGELMTGFGPQRQPHYKRPDDSRVVDRWTHDIVVQGVDGGGDVGKYRFFFDVSVTRTNKTTRV